MNRGRRIIQNTLWLLLHEVVANIAALFVVGFVADRLGRGSYGELEGAIAFVALFTPIVFAGIQLILVRHIVTNPDNGAEATGDAITIRFALAPLYAIAIMVIAPWVVPQISAGTLAFAIGNGFLVMFVQTFWIRFEVVERMHPMAVGGFISTSVTVGLSVAAVLLDFGPAGVAAARFGGNLAQTIYLAVADTLAFGRPRFAFNARRLWSVVRQGLPLAIQSLLCMILLAVDATMLVRLRGLEEVGLYSAATALAYKFVVLSGSLSTAILPGLVKARLESKKAFDGLLGRSMRFVLLLATPIAIGTWFVAEDVIDFIFREEFLPAARVLGILMCFIPFQFLNMVLVVAIGAQSKERYVAWGMGAAVATNIGCNAVLIPWLGFEGAGIATVFTEVLLTVVCLIVLRSHLLGVIGYLKLGRVALANVAVVGICLILRGQYVPVIIGGAVVVYLIAMFLLRCIDREEIRAVTGR